MAKDYLKKAIETVPDSQQLAWAENDFCAMIFFGMNTFSGRECGTGFEEPDLFNPTALNTDQWVKAVKNSGMQGLILSCKHYDGFCLWPTEQTEHSIKSSSWKDGQGDLVRAVSDSCKKYGIKFGISLPLWDMHEPSYGKGREYDVFFMNQLKELLTDYGEIFCVWLDGTCNRSKNEPVQEYDLDAYYKLIRDLQPNAAIADVGPDVRWCGNYMGVCRKSEWSVVPSYYNIIKRAEMKYTAPVNYALPDLGERKRIKKCEDFIWYPCAVNVSLREGRFYRKEEDYAVKPLSKVMKIYNGSAGANATLVLNLAPQPDGTLHEKDVEALLTVGAVLSLHFEDNLALDSSMEGNCKKDDLHAPSMALPDRKGYWHSGFDTKKPELILDMGDEYDVDRVVLRENIETGQQIEAFSIYLELDGKWKRMAKGTVIGNKRIVEFDYARRTRRVKLVIEKMREFATVKSFEVY